MIKKSWNEGLTKETDDRLVKAGRNISKALKGRKFTKEWKQNLSKSKTGFKHSEETKKKMSIARKGKKRSKEIRKKMSEAVKRRYRKKGTQHLIGQGNPNWRGGRRITPAGYIEIYCPNHPHVDKRGVVPEHHLTWEAYWNQFVPKNYIIHHCDGNKQNNEISNLALIKRSHHSSLHLRKRNHRGQFSKYDFHRLHL